MAYRGKTMKRRNYGIPLDDLFVIMDKEIEAERKAEKARTKRKADEDYEGYELVRDEYSR